nr:zinc finger protein 557-like [Aedes albopictus]XP_019559841.2 zinc finger protein 557-like [Aedes albopictus]
MDIENHPSASTSKAMRQNRPQEDQSTDSVCRVCMGWASDSDLMVGIFDGQVCSMILAEVLTLVGAVELATEDDQLPKWCCKGCLKALESAYKLRILCQESDRKLRHASLTDGTAVVVKEEVDEDMLNLVDHDGMLNVEEAVVVKEEVDEDLLNLVDQDGMLNVEEGAVSESIQLPKLEIVDCIEEDEIQQMEDGVGMMEDGMKEDNGSADSDEVDEDQDEKMSIAVNKSNRRKKPLNPNVYDEVEAVGFKCCGCSYIFNTSEELKTHSKEVHADKKLSIQELKHNKQCDICYKVMANNVYVRIHQQKDKLNYRCKVCGDLFWSRQKVCLHYDRVHDPNPESPSKVCCGCREEFETGEQLREHSVAVHLPEKPAPDPTRPYACNVCYRSFTSKTLLHAHQFRKLKHTKKHVCIQCGMAFRYPGGLKDHEMTHTGEKVFQCSKCPKAYSNRNTYRKHVASHEMPADKYKCEICGVTLKSLHGLRRHTLQHTGERPHRCPHCPATFAVPAGLKCHLFTHADEKTQECPICKKQFKRQVEVKRHLTYSHHKHKPFACFFCPKRYPRKHCRKQHMLQAHPKELQSNPLPPIELLGNPWSMRQRTEEAILREQGMVE